MACHILLFALLALASSRVMASDPSQLQDFCVVDLKSPSNYSSLLSFTSFNIMVYELPFVA